MALDERRSTGSFGTSCTAFMVLFPIVFIWSCVTFANESLINCYVQALFIPPIINNTTPYSLNTSTTIFYGLQLSTEYKLMSVYYDNVTLTFSYAGTPEGNIPIPNQTLPGFQKKGSTYLSDYVGTHRSVDVSWSLFVVFRVDLTTAVRFKLWLLKGKKRHRFVARGEIHFNQLTGKMIGAKRVKLKRFAGHHRPQTAFRAEVFSICFVLVVLMSILRFVHYS